MKVYQYPRCSTCRKALKFLDAQRIEYESIDIVERPPSIAELKRVLQLTELPVGKLFNTSGQSYRDGDFKQKLQQMNTQEALAALAADGKLIKRPLVLGKDFARVGFSEEQYRGLARR
ncbi:MAG TPA: arsenate reductase family protein [Polyangiaceae bacterium]|jgi:arsenate reductase|nr:arsenate reductase family protein [Polyangiaceae bacterium]